MTWYLLEEQWLRAGRHVYFAPEDDAGIAAFEEHLRSTKQPFVVHTREDVPAVVFAPPSKRVAGRSHAKKSSGEDRSTTRAA